MKQKTVYFKRKALAPSLEIPAIILVIIPIPLAFYYLTINHVSFVIILISTVLTPIFIAYCFMARCEYSIDLEKLTVTLKPLFSYTPFIIKSEKTYYWEDLENYKLGSVPNQFGEARTYIQLKFKNQKRKINITEGLTEKSRESNRNFRAFFIEELSKRFKVEEV